MRRPADLWKVMLGLFALLVCLVALVAIGFEARQRNGQPVWTFIALAAVGCIALVVDGSRTPARDRQRRTDEDPEPPEPSSGSSGTAPGEGHPSRWLDRG